jgi:L-lactate dehydrogenase complex protein LldE
MNMVKILEQQGCEVLYNAQQTCCGQPAYNAGYRNEARAVGHKFLKDFNSDTYIVTPGGSCAGYVRNHYDKLFDNSSDHNQCVAVQEKMFEFTEFLTNVLKVDDLGASFPAKATYHDACGALRECGIKEAPRRLLQKVNGLELVEMKECETCCGFGGTFAVKFEPVSIGMAQVKTQSAVASGAKYIISTDASCLLHLQSYIDKQALPLQTIHIADVLANKQ